MEDNEYNEEDAQDKLQDYQKKFRNMESDRKAYAEETVANIKKQRTIIDKLKNENTALKDLIAKLNNQQGAKVQTTQMFNKTQNAEALIEELKIHIEDENKKQAEIQRNIINFQKKILEKRQNLGGVNAGLENQNALTKQIKILENRLDKANQKFNESIAINKNLRQQIDSLRRERVIFDNLYKKLEKELHEKRKEMANIIETANTAYEERDKANDWIQNLKQQAKRESADFEKDLRELSQLMEKNKKTLEYCKMTEKNRIEQKKETEESEAEKLAKKTSQNIFKEKTVSQQNLEKINKFEEDLAKIQAATQVTDFEQLINIFVLNEEKTFKYVNELSNEIEDLEKVIQDLKEERSKYEGQGNQVEIQRKKLLKQLEEKLSRSENKSEQFEFKFHDQQNLQQLYILILQNWIETLFYTIECDKEMAKELAGSQGVTDSNMMIFLGIIEDRVNQILQTYTIINQNRGDQLRALTDVPYSLQKNANGMPPEGEADDEDIEGNKPFSREEFELKAHEKLENLRIEKEKDKTQKKQKGKSSFGKT